MVPPFRALLSLALVVVCGGGCTAKCRELEPVDDVRANLRERVDDFLDQADASEAQRVKVRALFEAALPARLRFRRETVPMLHALVSELRSETPNRQRQAAVIVQIADAGERYAQLIADLMLASHAEFTKEQRARLATKGAEPSPPFEGSWFLDRGIDLLVMRVDANREQELLIRRIHHHFEQQARKLQLKFDAMKVEAAAEFRRDTPDAAHVHAVVKRARAESERFMLELAGYEQLIVSKLDPRQRGLLNAELVRIEACPETKLGENSAQHSAIGGAARAVCAL